MSKDITAAIRSVSSFYELAERHWPSELESALHYYWLGDDYVLATLNRVELDEKSRKHHVYLQGYDGREHTFEALVNAGHVEIEVDSIISVLEPYFESDDMCLLEAGQLVNVH